MATVSVSDQGGKRSIYTDQLYSVIKVSIWHKNNRVILVNSSLMNTCVNNGCLVDLPLEVYNKQ